MSIERATPFWASALTLMATGCSSDAVAPAPFDDDPGRPALAVLISNPVPQPLPASSSASLHGAPALVAYVSLPPGTVPRGALLEVRNLRTAQAASRPMLEGGADPVMIQVLGGDSLDIVATDSAGGRFRKVDSVRTEVPPRVVRVEPAPGETDVPLNRIITVVFTEPVSLQSTAGNLRLLLGTDEVPAVASVSVAAPWMITLSPHEPLQPSTGYVLEVGDGVTDLDGDALTTPVSVGFTTGAAGGELEPRAVLRIHAVTTGEEPDPDGYQLAAYTSEDPDEDPYPGEYRQYRLPPNGVVDITDLPAGEYRLGQGAAPGGGHLSLLTLTVAPNCTPVAPSLAPEDVASVWLQVGTVTELTYEVSCVSRDEIFGSLEITASSSGPDLDDLYYLMVDGWTWIYGEGEEGPCYWQGCFVEVPANGTGRLDRGIRPGEYEISLTSVAPNCEASPARQIVTIQAGATATAAFQVVCSPLGRLALAHDTGGSTGFEIGLFDSNGGFLARLTNAAGDDVDPTWSPDGARIAFTSTRTGNREIFVMNADGTGPVRLTDHAAADHSPAWSPDGTRLTFVSERDGNAELYVMNVDGSGLARLTTEPAADADPDWSPDGTRIAFTSDRDGNDEIYVMGADGSAPLRLTTSASTEEDPAWSPDGGRLAFVSDRTNPVEPDFTGRQLFVMNADGTDIAAIPRAWSGRDPSWSPDGRTIAVIIHPDDQSDPYFPHLEVIRVDGTGATGVGASAVTGAAWRP